jgi:hypothetical protein
LSNEKRGSLVGHTSLAGGLQQKNGINTLGDKGKMILVFFE